MDGNSSNNHDPDKYQYSYVLLFHQTALRCSVLVCSAAVFSMYVCCVSVCALCGLLRMFPYVSYIQQ